MRDIEYSDIQELEDKWGELPSISFPAHMKVRIIPPYGDAIARFTVTTANRRGSVSVFLREPPCREDGLMWEVYPVRPFDWRAEHRWDEDARQWDCDCCKASSDEEVPLGVVYLIELSLDQQNEEHCPPFIP